MDDPAHITLVVHARPGERHGHGDAIQKERRKEARKEGSDAREWVRWEERGHQYRRALAQMTEYLLPTVPYRTTQYDTVFLSRGLQEAIAHRRCHDILRPPPFLPHCRLAIAIGGNSPSLSSTLHIPRSLLCLPSMSQRRPSPWRHDGRALQLKVSRLGERHGSSLGHSASARARLTG